jgi:chromosome segregation protein
LLKLRKVELIGFKSFCEKTQITFSGSGVTCIVGPNGCGKSNIVDAISWVLGEQSHKSLRAERMADCIFNGTAKRPPLGLAEVSLTLVDPELAEAAAKILEASAEAEETPEAAAEDLTTKLSDPSADVTVPRKPAPAKPSRHIRPGEVVIGRRLYRSGLSEYLINGRTARLRDVQELFMGMGLGPDSYAIIEQGRIGQILSSKPTDRRAIIEEAAGVTKYKTKKRLAEAKLESSKLNLARVNDILVEVEKQLAALKRQASKARRYAELREQMRCALRQVLASKAKELDAEADRLTQLLREITTTEAQQVQALKQMEAEQERLSSRTYELESELRQNQNLLGQTALELDRAENRIGFNRQRSQELEARGRQLADEIEQAASQAAQLEARTLAHQQAVAGLREQTLRLERHLLELSERTQELTSSAQAAEERIAELRLATGQLGEELTRLHGEYAQAEQALAHHVEALAHQEQTEQQLLEEALHHRERAQAADLYWQAAVERARSLEHAVRETQARIAERRGQQQETTTSFESARDALAGARARRASLEQILNDRSYTADAVQKLFASNGEAENRGFRAVGVLADYAEVAEQYESAVEQFLREELEYVVVETFDHARAGIALLREEVGGCATFFVDSLHHLEPSANEPVVPFPVTEGVVSRLDRLVEFRDPLGPAAKQFLPRLQSAFLVESAAVAEGLARENPADHFVTPDGTCYQGRVVSGGRPAEAGPLVMKRELRALDAEILQLERAAAQAQAALRRIEEDLRAHERSLEETTAQHLESEKTVVAATHQRDQARAELARLGMELAACQNEIAGLRNEVQSARRRAEQARQQHSQATQSRTATENEMAQAIEGLASLRQLIEAHQEELAARRAEAATLAERLSSAEALAARLAEDQRALREREASLREQQAALHSEQEELSSHTAEQQCQVETLRAERASLESRKIELEREWEQARVRTVELDDALRTSRQKLGDLREERGRHEIDRARNDADREHLRETCLAELNAHPEDLIAEGPSLLSGDALVTAETNYREMKARMEAMGPVNMMALEEYQECERRHGFLARERDDLLRSITDTQQAITELDQVSRQKFEQAFAAINGNFAEAFRTLFGGGTGEMRLSEPDSSGEAGIDIVAQPPGKRLQNVLLLSGGEKALTALALLIAIFHYQPSPFCILDEVDAPLDEANVGLFTKLVTEMSAQTQFVIVTHNRRTMEMAPVLYGVTMQEPGVSKLVSVRWDEPIVSSAHNAA